MAGPRTLAVLCGLRPTRPRRSRNRQPKIQTARIREPSKTIFFVGILGLYVDWTLTFFRHLNSTKRTWNQSESRLQSFLGLFGLQLLLMYALERKFVHKVMVRPPARRKYSGSPLATRPIPIIEPVGWWMNVLTIKPTAALQNIRESHG